MKKKIIYFGFFVNSFNLFSMAFIKGKKFSIAPRRGPNGARPVPGSRCRGLASTMKALFDGRSFFISLSASKGGALWWKFFMNLASYRVGTRKTDVRLRLKIIRGKLRFTPVLH